MPKDKIAVKKIWLARGEGPTAEIGQVTIEPRFSGARRGTTSEHLYDLADAVLRLWASSAPASGGYDKVDFIVTFDDGETYEGRFDMTRADRFEEQLLQRHMWESLTFSAGVRKPSHLSKEDYKRYLANIGPDRMREAKEMLDKYMVTA